MAVTAADTPIRIVCANTVGAALRQAEHGADTQRAFRFRHTGNLQSKFAEARQVLEMTIDYQTQFKALADRLALEPISRAPPCAYTLAFGARSGARRASRVRPAFKLVAVREVFACFAAERGAVDGRCALIMRQL